MVVTEELTGPKEGFQAATKNRYAKDDVIV